MLLKFILLCSTIAWAYGSIEYDGMVFIKLEHALGGVDNSAFIERGNISIPSLRIGTSVVNQIITNEDRLKIRQLALENKFYQLKATVATNDGSHSFSSFIKACMLAEAELNDIITITLDYIGRIITITESIASTSACQGSDVQIKDLKEFITSVHVRHTYSGPSPDTATYIQKIEREKEAKEKGDVKDNRSFLAKYWMYILPVVVVMVISSAANPDGAGGGR